MTDSFLNDLIFQRIIIYNGDLVITGEGRITQPVGYRFYITKQTAMQLEHFIKKV